MLFTRRAIGLPRCGAGCADRKVSQARNPLPLRMDWSQSLRLDTALLRLGEAFLALFVHLCFSRFLNAFSSQLFSSAVVLCALRKHNNDLRSQTEWPHRAVPTHERASVGQAFIGYHAHRWA